MRYETTSDRKHVTTPIPLYCQACWEDGAKSLLYIEECEICLGTGIEAIPMVELEQ
jgi:hypothetical protein